MTSIMKSPNMFPNGLIDIFKQFKVVDLNIINVNHKGEVSCSMDGELGRKILKITGNLSAGNFLEIPNSKYSKSLNFSGKYYYIFIKAFTDSKFSFQLAYTVNMDHQIKFNFKFPLKEIKFSRSSTYNIDIPLIIDHTGWHIIKFDPVDYINANLINKYKEFSNLGGITVENTILKSITFNSTMNVRGVYISNSSFNINTLPKEMAVKIVDQSHPNSNINLIDLISEIEKNLSESALLENELKDQTNRKNNFIEEFDRSENEIQKNSKENAKRLKETYSKSTIKKLEMTNSANSFNISDIKSDKYEKYNNELKEVNNEELKKNMEIINKEYANSKKEMIKNIFQKEDNKRKPLLPDPIMNLKFILGYTATNCPNVKFYSKDHNINSNAKNNIFFASCNNIIKYDYSELKQKFFFGHSKPITNYVLACDGEILFSCQEGKNAIIRVWRVETCRCIKILTTPYEKISSLSVSKDSRILCTVGIESYNKELIILWDISDIDNIKVLIRQSSHFPINQIKFSPFDQNVLLSCGKENIKFWRIKNDHLGGKAVVLNQYARENIFLCLDFDNPFIGEELNKGRVFVGSSKGCIFQVSCNTQELEAIYKIQDSAILSICVNDAFCATGSQDGHLRVWPIDFKEFLIEAKHDSGVCSVDISFDALEIICGTLNGSVGILNIDNKQYKTILRSPPGKVQAMTAHPSGNYLFTIEDDKSVRVWDIDNKSEAFQFISTKDPPTAIGVPNKMIFACGFSSGLVKIFDLDKTSILYECKAFNSSIKHLKFIQNDSLLISMNSQGNMSIHDCNNNFIQIKLIKIDEPTLYTDISLAPEEDYFGTIGPESNCVIVWNAKTFGIKNRIPINNYFVNKVYLINKNIIAVILENCSIQFYSLAAYEGILIKEMPNVHLGKIKDFTLTKNFKYFISGGEEGMIKIWDSKMLYKNFISFQQYIGHSNSIRSVICLENKSLVITVSENSGIFFWNFLGDLTFSETEITQEYEKFGNIKEMKDFVINNNQKQKKGTLNTSNASMNTVKNIKINHLEKAYKLEHNENSSTEKRNKFNIENKENENSQVFTMLPIEFEDKDYCVDLSNSQSSQFLGSDAFKKLNLLNTTFTNVEELSCKVLFTPKFKPTKLEKFVMPKQCSDKLNKQLVLGYSTSSYRNLVYNKEKCWFAFTVNNKIVVEHLEENRLQTILEEHLDEISCLVLSNDGKYLISGSGYVHKDDTAPICVWDTATWSLKKRLNFHYKGIQTIKFSSNGKYMISIGNKEEKSICLWNFSNLTVIDSKSLKFPVIDLVCEKNINETFLYFVTISFSVISFWIMDTNYRLEGFHVKYENLVSDREEGEVITAIELTPYYSKVHTSFVLLGTNTGAIVVIDKEKKNLLKKYYISKCPITKINFYDDRFICSGDAPIVYVWKFNPNELNYETLFEFFEKEKSNLIFVDSNIIATDYHQAGNEGLIGTDIGSIFYSNFSSNTTIKIISSHYKSFINSIALEPNENCILTGGDDGTVRCWTEDTFDQKYQIIKLDETKCDEVAINSLENICAVIYDSSFIRIYNLETLKSLGKIKIPDNDINHMSYIFNYQALLVTTLQDKMFLLDVQNWDPLNVLFTEISNSFMPKNQFFKSIDTKDISPTKTFSAFSFSDGTTCVILIEKISGKIETSILDKFNMLEHHIQKSDDAYVGEMYKNLTNLRTNYISSAKFSNKFDDCLFTFHECLQFLYIRNFKNNEIHRRIPLDFFPTSISLSNDDTYIALGTKEGLVLFITRMDDATKSGFNLDIYSGHFDMVKTLKFNKNTSKLFSTSHSEMIVWNIN